MSNECVESACILTREWVFRLPIAPSMKLFCVYGHGKETEVRPNHLGLLTIFAHICSQRSYWYARGAYEHDEAAMADAPGATCASEAECTNERPPLDLPLSRSSFIDVGVQEDRTESPIKIRSGVGLGEGDGTVSLISLGAMCAEGWRRERWNPGGIKVKTYEVRLRLPGRYILLTAVTIQLQHQPNYNLRGGAQTAEHVDVLGSTPLNELILKVAAGAGDEIQERFVSPVREYAKKMRWDP